MGFEGAQPNKNELQASVESQEREKYSSARQRDQVSKWARNVLIGATALGAVGAASDKAEAKDMMGTTDSVASSLSELGNTDFEPSPEVQAEAKNFENQLSSATEMLRQAVDENNPEIADDVIGGPLIGDRHMTEQYFQTLGATIEGTDEFDTALSTYFEKFTDPVDMAQFEAELFGESENTEAGPEASTEITPEMQRDFQEAIHSELGGDGASPENLDRMAQSYDAIEEIMNSRVAQESWLEMTAEAADAEAKYELAGLAEALQRAGVEVGEDDVASKLDAYKNHLNTLDAQAYDQYTERLAQHNEQLENRIEKLKESMQAQSSAWDELKQLVPELASKYSAFGQPTDTTSLEQRGIHF